MNILPDKLKFNKPSIYVHKVFTKKFYVKIDNVYKIMYNKCIMGENEDFCPKLKILLLRNIKWRQSDGKKLDGW